MPGRLWAVCVWRLGSLYRIKCLRTNRVGEHLCVQYGYQYQTKSSWFARDLPGFEMKILHPKDPSVPGKPERLVMLDVGVLWTCSSPQSFSLSLDCDRLIVHFLRFISLSEDIVPRWNAESWKRGKPLNHCSWKQCCTLLIASYCSEQGLFPQGIAN